MKFTTTATSSLLLATMAMSPSLSVAAPTGMELPTSPNPAGTPSIRQFAPSPLFDGSPTTKNNRAPALRTGPGSPRRSIPARMLRVYKRKDAQSSDPLAGVVDPLVSTTGSLLHTIYGTLDGLPVLGGVLKKLLPVVPDAHAQAVSAASAPISVASHASDSTSNSGLKFPIDPGHLLDEVPSASNTLGDLGRATIGGLGGTINGLPVPSTLEGPLPLGGVVGGLPSPIGLGILPSGSNPSIPHIPLEPQTPHPQQPDNIIQLPNGGLLVDIDGVWKEIPGSRLPAFGDVLAAESDHSSSATGPQRSVAGVEKSASQVPGLSVHPPSPPASHIPVHPSQPVVSSPHAPQAAAAAAGVTPQGSNLLHPGTPSGTISPNTPAHPNPSATRAVGVAPTAAASSRAGGIPPAGHQPSIQAAEFQPESTVRGPASSPTVSPASHTVTPDGAEPSVAAASLTDSADVDHGPSNPAPGLIHGMSAP